MAKLNLLHAELLPRAHPSLALGTTFPSSSATTAPPRPRRPLPLPPRRRQAAAAAAAAAPSCKQQPSPLRLPAPPRPPPCNLHLTSPSPASSSSPCRTTPRHRRTPTPPPASPQASATFSLSSLMCICIPHVRPFFPYPETLSTPLRTHPRGPPMIPNTPYYPKMRFRRSGSGHVLRLGSRNPSVRGTCRNPSRTTRSANGGFSTHGIGSMDDEDYTEDADEETKTIEATEDDSTTGRTT